jgi:general secretion pathway protein A
MHRRARGIPRLVNLLCDRALLAGYAAGKKHIGPDLVGVAAREILGARRRVLRRRPWIRRSYVAGAALVLLAGGVLAWQQWTRVGPRVAIESAPSGSLPAVGAAPRAARSPVRRVIAIGPPLGPGRDAGWHDPQGPAAPRAEGAQAGR